MSIRWIVDADLGRSLGSVESGRWVGLELIICRSKVGLDLSVMLQFDKFGSVIRGNGLLKEVRWCVLKQLFLFWSILSCTDANLHGKMLEREAVSPGTVLLDSPAMPELPLPANLPSFHKPRRNHISPYVAPSQSPTYGHFEISAPPSSSFLPKNSMPKSASVPASDSHPRLSEVAPAQPKPGTITAGLAQPPLSPSISSCCGPDMVHKRESRGCHCVYPIKLDILLLNVSSNPNWTLFLEQFASQLGLRVSQIELINFAKTVAEYW